MSLTINRQLSRIGVFYDGNYFRRVSNFYANFHPRRARISISGLHQFIRERAAHEQSVDLKFTQVVDAHYFRGRVKAREAEERDILFNERSFEDVLMHEGVTTHYLPVARDGGEKGIDVWFALEAFEMAIYKRFDVIALVAADGDFVPLVRKLNTLGTRVMLLAWDFSYIDSSGTVRETHVSQALRSEVTYPLMMANIIDDPANDRNESIEGLFHHPERRQGSLSIPSPLTAGQACKDVGARSMTPRTYRPSHRADSPPGLSDAGHVYALKETYGFIRPDRGEPDSIFFPFSALPPADPQKLTIGTRVSFDYMMGDRGFIARNISILEHQD